MEKRGPWAVKKHASVYKNPWMEAFHDDVIRPDGKPGIFGYVKIKPGVSFLPMDDDGNVYLVEEFYYAMNRNTILAPCGGREPNETPLDCAKRELREELGIEAKEWFHLGTVDPMSPLVDSPQDLFLARKLSFHNHHREGTEVINPIKMKFEEAVRKVIDNSINESFTCLLILKANEYLH
ncbi:MAG: NUDIX hydrolase [Candidatus Woesearchaeota archaeon]